MARGSSKRRRRREPTHAAAPAVGGRKLVPGDQVEVFCSDHGLSGSWHQAVVIGFHENSRTVRYIDLVDEGDMGSQLVENIAVSDAIEGKSSVPVDFTRGKIRPLLPHAPLKASDVSYGLCVDALVEGSYWEGVITDHMEGSIERKVLFPDEGDERNIVVDQLRLTQDWDEVTAAWKPRGSWVFLQILHSHEEKDGLPVSVRQIWYDLRSKPSFVAEVKMWMCGTEAFWEKSISELVRELWSLCDSRSNHEGAQLGDSYKLLETSTSAILQKEKVQSIDLDKLDSMAAVLSQAVSEFISNYRNNNRKGALAKLELAKHHLKSLGWMLVEDKPKYKYYVSPDGKRFPSLIGACEASLALNRTTNPQENAADNLDLNSIIHRDACYKSNMDLVPRESETNYSLRTSVSTSWEPVQLGAEYSPEIVSLLSKHQEGRSTLLQRRVTNQTLKIKLRKHLLALGWGIKSKIDRSTRFRYDSPNGKSYYSFPQVFHSLMDGSIKGSRGYRIEGKPEQHNYLEWNTAEIHAKQSRDILILGKLKPEYQSDAIADYLHYTGAAMQNFRISQQKELGEQVRLSAKGHLKSSGWKFQSKQRSDDRQEMRYRAPHGRSYNSLLAACKEHLEVYQNSDNASPEITTNDCTDGSMHSFKLIGLNSGLRDSSGRQKSQNQLVSIAERFDNMLILPTHSSGHGKSKKRKVSPVQLSQAHILRSRARNGQILSCQHRAKTILSLLMDKNILLPRDKLTYKQRSDGPRMKEGLITGDGIKCMCCNEVFTLANFESHAGSSTQRPSAHMFLKDGRSLSQCLVQLMGENKPKGSLHVRLKGKYSDLENDSICSICHDGGEILLCDHCPSSFHHACVGLEVTPEGSWYCPSCRCNICDSSDYDPDSNKFTDKTIMYCDQCEREYHVGCIRNKGHHLSCHPQRGWLCSRECSKIFQHLQKLIGKSFPTPVEGLSCTILRFSRENASSCGDCDDETMAEQHAKLCVALDVLHECFVTIIEPRTQSDLSEDIVFNRESELRRLNFRGCYTILLEKGDELISVGTFRVFGKKIAELPLIGTRVPYRRQGMCRLLMNELEKLLSGLGVERLLLPAVPQLLETWTGSFGFTIMSYSDRLELAENIILSFQGTTMCQKVINNAGNVPEELRGFDDQPESTSMHREREDNDGQESTSEVVENRKQLEPMLLLEKQSNSSEEGICPIDTINSPSSSCIPDLVSSAEDKREQPQVSVHADQCKDNCVLTEVKPVAPQAIPTLKYKTSGKCYQRISKSAGGRNAWLKISIR